MRWPLSARLLLTILSTLATTLVVFLIAVIVEEQLADNYAGAITETTSAIWTVGTLLIFSTAAGVWTVAGYLLQPLHDLRRDLRLAARTRAIAEPHAGELSEIYALRADMLATLQELDTRAQVSDSERYRVLGMFESITEGLVQIGPGARFVHVNNAARLLLGLPPNAEGQTARSLIRNTELRDLFENVAAGEPVAAVEVVLDARQLLVTPQVLRGGNIVVSVVNLTELRRLESVRRDFVANVSHELKTPLASIQGYAETMLAEDLPHDVQAQFLDVIYKNAVRLHHVVDDLLDLSRLQSGGWRPDLQPVDAIAIAREVWASCDDIAARKNVRFGINGESMDVTADPAGLRQVFANLFNNAIRYSHEGGTITLTSRPVSNEAGRAYIELEVRDTGIGIPQDALPRIFERFFRVDPARSREQGGTGLGLSIVKHLVERMAGEVVAESQLGKGTSIIVRLPVAKDE